VVLSRRLAESGLFPAIDMLQSVSRVMTDVVPEKHLKLAQQSRDLLSAYRDSADLIELGAYQAGSNPRVDRALKCQARLQSFRAQAPNERVPMAETLRQLEAALAEGGPRG
jgi:flagellum-specific ATP synthase